MKKLGILVMAMVMVLGLSLGVMAQLTEEEIGVEISTDPIATMEHDLSDPITMNIENLTDGPFESDAGEFTVKANTDVAISVEQDYSNADDVFEGYGDHQIFWGESDNDNWIISPNVKIASINGKGTSKQGGPGEWAGENGRNDIEGAIGESVEIINFDSGVNSFELFMNTDINEEYDWYEFNSEETLDGTLTVTVSGQ